jgi:lipopolysaccharide transport system ATP-binding protein
MIYGGTDVFRSMIGLPKKRDFLRDKEIWALKDVNFEVRKGETLGVIGINGSGKTTLLRILSGIYPPDAGKVSIMNPLGALIAAGAGFHPEMTGRENIYMNGSIIGLKRKEIDEKLDEIIEFSELENFIDTPVKFYSSGMYVRLGFSIAANIRPNILVMDEILSVGDMSFRNKCFRKLKDLRDTVDAVLFVSHSMDHIRNICTQLVFLDAGQVMFQGDVDEGINRYMAHTDDISKRGTDAEVKRRQALDSFSFNSDEAVVEEIEVGSQSGVYNDEISSGDDLVIRIGFKTSREIIRPQFSIAIVDGKNTDVLWQKDHDNKIHFERLGAGEHYLKIIFRQPPLVAGVYRIGFAIRDTDSCEILTKSKRVKTFVIRGQKFPRSIVVCESVWELDGITKGDY